MSIMLEVYCYEYRLRLKQRDWLKYQLWIYFAEQMLSQFTGWGPLIGNLTTISRRDNLIIMVLRLRAKIVIMTFVNVCHVCLVLSVTSSAVGSVNFNNTPVNAVSQCMMAADCQCDVHLSAQSTSVIISSITSNKSSAECPFNTKQWNLHVQNISSFHSLLHLNIKLHQFDPDNRMTVLFIRDGMSPLSELIWSSHGHSNEKIEQWISLRPVLTVYFTASLNHSEQFTAVITGKIAHHSPCL